MYNVWFGVLFVWVVVCYGGCVFGVLLFVVEVCWCVDVEELVVVVACC